MSTENIQQEIDEIKQAIVAQEAKEKEHEAAYKKIRADADQEAREHEALSREAGKQRQALKLDLDRLRKQSNEIVLASAAQLSLETAQSATAKAEAAQATVEKQATEIEAMKQQAAKSHEQFGLRDAKLQEAEKVWDVKNAELDELLAKLKKQVG